MNYDFYLCIYCFEFDDSGFRFKFVEVTRYFEMEKHDTIFSDFFIIFK